jgi:hypothetical protein
LPFSDLESLVDCEIAKNLGQASLRPEDLEHLDRGGGAEPDLLPERVGAKAPSAVDVPIDPSLLSAFPNAHSYPRSDGRAIRRLAHELELQPVVRKTRILVEDIAENTA